MEQHPVPQNVTTFQFRLIGDMTIKQFGCLAAGTALAYISYKLPLPFFFTWPLTVLFAFLGFGLAFIPIEERPMDIWVMSFLKSIYSPTQYVWHRVPPTTQPITEPPPVTPKPAIEALRGLYAQPQRVARAQYSFFDRMFNWVDALFPTAPPVQLPVQKPVQTQPPTPVAGFAALQNQVATLQNQTDKKFNSPPRPQPILRSDRSANGNKPTGTVFPRTQRGPTVKIITPEATTRAGIPRLTTFANVVTGIIKDNEGALLPNVLVTVRDKEGIPLRALKTNKLGQFAASTQLPNGVYMVEVEDPRGRFIFDRAQITLTGAVMPALEIAAKSRRELERERLAKQIFGQNSNT